jgi:hypothetical protein
MTPKQQDFLLALADRIEHAQIMSDIDAPKQLREIAQDSASRLHLSTTEDYDQVATLTSLLGASKEEQHLFCLGMAHMEYLRKSVSNMSMEDCANFFRSIGNPDEKLEKYIQDKNKPWWKIW